MSTVIASRIVLQDNQGNERVILELNASNQVQISVVAQNGRKAVDIHESFDGDGVLYLNGDGSAIEMNAEGQSPSLGINMGNTMPLTLGKSGLHTHRSNCKRANRLSHCRALFLRLATANRSEMAECYRRRGQELLDELGAVVHESE